MRRIVANNHNLTHFFCCSLMLSQNEIFRNSIRNALCSAPSFIEWFILKDLDIRNVKYCSSHLKFCFFIKTKKMIFLEVKMTIIGENWYQQNAYSVSNKIIHKESHSCEKMRFYTHFLQKLVILSLLSTDLHINAIMMAISQMSF